MGLGRVLAPRFLSRWYLYPLAALGAPSAARDFLFAQFAGGAGRWPSYGVIAERWPQPRQADGSRTCARSEFRAGLQSLSVGGRRRRALRGIFFLLQFAGGAGRWPSYGVVGEGWPQPRQADGSRTCARCRDFGRHLVALSVGGGRRRALRRIFFLHNSPAALAAGRATGWSPTAGRSRGKLMGLGRVLAPRFRPGMVVFIRWRRWAAPSAARDFFLYNSPAALAAGRATGWSATAGRSRGKLMGLGRVLAVDFRPAHWWSLSVGGAGRRRAPRGIFFLHNSPAALAAGRATGWSPTAGRSRGKLMGLGRVLAVEISGRHLVVFIRWRRWAAPSAARDFLFAAIRRRRWPLAELRGDRRTLAAAAAS